MDEKILRDGFAMAALAGLLAGEYADCIYAYDNVALQAYELADAMLAAREQRPEAGDAA